MFPGLTTKIKPCLKPSCGGINNQHCHISLGGGVEEEEERRGEEEIHGRGKEGRRVKGRRKGEGQTWAAPVIMLGMKSLCPGASSRCTLKLGVSNWYWATSIVIPLREEETKSD